ncbi:MAG: hypothetical protein CO108_08170 [Deltaproteobacteria bacterium CG_4_9_14_3_um_filter_63_12]|nr:MAG: hypothetical protein CO108_08170 [Deltaproteobacteria bacterium CG_4_9_14_3_um_filter_63_12]
MKNNARWFGFWVIFLLGACSSESGQEAAAPEKAGPQSEVGAALPVVPGTEVVGAHRRAELGKPSRETDPGRLSPERRLNLTVRHVMEYPTRVAKGPDGRFYISDAKVGSVFVLDAEMKKSLAEFKVGRPLGVAVDASGTVYVGQNGGTEVAAYGSAGEHLFTLNGFEMANDLAVDPSDKLYVVDSKLNTLRVFAAGGAELWTSTGPEGDGFSFPSSVALGRDGEVFVADQGKARIVVLGADGQVKRSFGQPVEAFSSDWKGRFVKVQSLFVDAEGQLHAADSYLNRVQILNAETGEYLSHYGEFGAGAGQLTLPLDVWVDEMGDAIVTNAENGRLERFASSRTRKGE